MTENKLCEIIQKKLSAQGINLSDTEINNLYISAINTIYDKLDEDEESINIADFGSFWQKKTETSSVKFFRPTEELLDNINEIR